VSAFLSVTSEAMNAALTAPSAPVVSISVEDVRFALANIDQLDVLATSPLAALEICRGDSPAVQLQAILSESVESLDEVISTRRAYRILHAAFVERRGKHEQIARELGIPYGTFRRQMMRGIEQVRQSLIQRGTARAGVVSGE
jgi:transcriptional regulator with AAA-type ATPase domain